MATQSSEHTMVPHMFHVNHECPKIIATRNGTAEKINVCVYIIPVAESERGMVVFVVTTRHGHTAVREREMSRRGEAVSGQAAVPKGLRSESWQP
jgi:hypothetical protein